MQNFNVAKPMEQVEPVLIKVIRQVAGPSAEIEPVWLLLGTLNWTAFAGMLCRTGRWKKDPREFVEMLLEHTQPLF